VSQSRSVSAQINIRQRKNEIGEDVAFVDDLMTLMKVK